MQPKQTSPTMTIRTKPKTIQPIPKTKSFTTTETKPRQNKTYNLGNILEIKKSSKTGQD